MIWIVIAVIVFIISACLFFHEIKQAPMIDDKEPFLWDDYDPKKDQTIKEEEETDEVRHFVETFCSHCKHYDGVTICLNEKNFGTLSIDLVKYCKEKSIFEVK